MLEVSVSILCRASIMPTKYAYNFMVEYCVGGIHEILPEVTFCVW